MEQKYYSIRSILEERYLRVELVEKFDLDIDSLSGKTTLDKINYAYSLLKAEDSNVDVDYYIRFKHSNLLKMLDVILGLNYSQKLLRNDPKSKRPTYKFNNDNKMFFEFLLDLYENKKHPDVSHYLKKEFLSIESETFVDILRKGFIELASNNNTLLSIEQLEDKWKNAFHEELIPNACIKEIFELAEDVKNGLVFFLTPVPDKKDMEKNDATFEAIKEILQVCEDAIHSIGTRYKQSQYPVLDMIELEKNITQGAIREIQKKHERMEMAKMAKMAWYEREERMRQEGTEQESTEQRD